MKYKPEINKRIDRYRKLWQFQELDPPLIMIDIPESPVSAYGNDCVFWDNPEAFISSHLDSLVMRRLIPDDTIPMLRPPFSHAALPAILGAEPELRNGKLWVRPVLDDLKEYRRLFVSGETYWFSKIKEYYQRLLELAGGRFAVGCYEVTGPPDLMGALRGFEAMLLDIYDDPDTVSDFALYAAGTAVKFYEQIRGLLSMQERYGGCWIANSWAPEDTIYFCEHTSVSYSPPLYEKFIKPATCFMLRTYRYALTYVYCTAGSQHITSYFNRGIPVWVRSCDGNPPAEIVERFRGQAIVSIHTTADEFHSAYSRYGGKGICYQVSCGSLNEAKGLCSSVIM